MGIDGDGQTPHIVEIIIIGSIGILAAVGYLWVKFSTRRFTGKITNNGHDVTMKIRQDSMYTWLVAAFICLVAVIFVGSTFLSQEEKTRSDGVQVNWGRWIELGIVGLFLDVALALDYLKLKREHVVMIALASIISWASGIFAVISSGNNFYYWWAIGVVAYIFLSSYSFRRTTPNSSYFLIILPTYKLAVVILLWLNSILGPARVDAFSYDLDAWFYCFLDMMFVLVGLFAAFTYEYVQEEYRNAIYERFRVSSSSKKPAAPAVPMGQMQNGGAYTASKILR